MGSIEEEEERGMVENGRETAREGEGEGEGERERSCIYLFKLINYLKRANNTPKVEDQANGTSPRGCRYTWRDVVGWVRWKRERWGGEQFDGRS